MATSTAQLDTEDFLREFFPPPSCDLPTSGFKMNPFVSLEKADTMPESRLSDLLVSLVSTFQ